MALDPRSLHLYARRLLSSPGSGDRLLLVVDQFEELFTLCKDRAQRKAFVDALLTAACPSEGSPCSPAESVVTVVLTLRADFYANCAEFENLRVALQDSQRFIGAMSKEELRRAIEEPAKRGNWELESGLVYVLMQDVGDEPGALPLLSHALLETWKRRRGRTLTLAGYAASGRVQGAIAKTADEIYYFELTPEQQAIARNIFLRLTELGDGAQDTRRRVTLSELIPQDESAEEVQAVLQKLADRRLVITYQNEAEVADEALIREWPVLRAWVEEDREALRVQRRLSETAHEWEVHNRDESYLYRGARLVEATELLKTRVPFLSRRDLAFLDESTTRNNNSRRTNLTLASVLGTIGLGALKDQLEGATEEYQRLFSEYERLTEQLTAIRRELDVKNAELDGLAPVVFISYAKEDFELADQLYGSLLRKGLRPWMDKRNLLPGENWQSRIKQAVYGSDFLIACLSRSSVAKRGYVQTEFKLALDVVMQLPEGSIYLIPVRMDDCEIPSSLSQWQYVDFKEPEAVDRIVEAVLTEWNRRRTQRVPKRRQI